jgi:GT2 family glycosyltransferase
MVGLHYGHHEPDEPGVHDELREVDFVTGAAMLLRVSALAEVGPFNEAFSPGYYEDVELCARLRTAGWSVLIVPSARAFHAESSSFSDRDTRLRLAHRNRYLFLLPRLADVTFREEFMAAEVAFLRDEAHFDELRAIRSAVLDLQSRLGGLVVKRLAGRPCPRDLADAASAVLDRLSEASADELLARVRRIRSPSPGAAQ